MSSTTDSLTSLAVTGFTIGVLAKMIKGISKKSKNTKSTSWFK